MRYVDTLPREVQQDEHVWVSMSDGTRLAARIWRPVGSDTEPVPAILEYIPYRQRDLSSSRDAIHHPYMAGHGYACVRVDIRGTGNSEGVLLDEYTDQEQQDAEEVLAWLADQPWCDGRTGMMGISWGGFAALQVAARRPPSLGAVVACSFTDERYEDDMHYMGGCLLSDNLSEAGTMFAYATCPPDPAVVGDAWRDMWRERLRGSGPWLEEWLRHQRRDPYWRRASVCEDYSAVDVPVFAVSGWADGYSNAVFRVLANLDVPRKGLVGPWSHKYPHLGQPGPAVGFLQEVVEWWDHWLKDVDNAAMDVPMLRTWMQDSVPPSTAYEDRPGRWVGEPAWPSPYVEKQEHMLTRHRIGHADESVPKDELTVESPLSVGQFAGKWASYNAPPDLPYDQREEDGGSMVFDTDVLTERCEILGGPIVRLDLAADRPVAMVAARLSDVSPDGRATRVTYGLLNLTHRDGHSEPEPLVPGQRYQVEFQLNGVAQAFPPGHRIRLSLSTSYWPLAWPPPEPAQLSVFTGSSSLLLPVRATTESDEVAVRPFDEPEGTPPLETRQVQPGEWKWEVSRDLVGYGSKMEVVKDVGTVRYEDVDLDVARRAYDQYTSVADDFTSVQGDVRWSMSFSRGDWHARTVTRQTLSCSATDFFLHAELDAYEGARRTYSDNWQITIPRDNL
ncbi:MAG TPA: CocE/NonD family hydrolase [Nocardioidaceae bacterium]|nr:CocE/NonD family hydrolase [Nocardioidaceae bacterium]